MLKMAFGNINFGAPKCTKKGLFYPLLIFAPSCGAKINCARKLMGLRYMSNHL